MFGYVIANTERLTPEDQAAYKACYCGLCHELGQRYGKMSRLILNYDLVFLIIMRSSLETQVEPVMRQERCVAHPAKPHYYWLNEETEYAADMSILLAYYQMEDDWQDDRKLLALGQRQFLKNAFRQVSQRYPATDGRIRQGLQALSQIEKSGRLDPDGAARAFGQVMRAVFEGPEENGLLGAFGMALGKWIYIMDACLDRKEDLKKERYNPLPALPADQFETVLNCLMAECVEAYRKLPVQRNQAIMENILYSGVWTRFEAWKKENRNERPV